MDKAAFIASLHDDAPPQLPPALAALWHAARKEWDEAHEIVQDESSRDAAWVHALLHRQEGDEGNAGYWYRQAGKHMPAHSIEEEWDAMVDALLQK